MPTRRRQQFVHALTVWLLGVLLILATLGSLSLELYFVLSLVGLLVVIELTAPFNVTPRWRRRLKWLVALGLIGFVAIVVGRILEILSSGVL